VCDADGSLSQCQWDSFVTFAIMNLTYLQTHSLPVGLRRCEDEARDAGGWLFPVRYEGSFCPFVEKKVINGLCSIRCNNTSLSLRAKKQVLLVMIDSDWAFGSP
jgi:hypothetical protein